MLVEVTLLVAGEVTVTEGATEVAVQTLTLQEEGVSVNSSQEESELVTTRGVLVRYEGDTVTVLQGVTTDLIKTMMGQNLLKMLLLL